MCITQAKLAIITTVAPCEHTTCFWLAFGQMRFTAHAPNVSIAADVLPPAAMREKSGGAEEEGEDWRGDGGVTETGTGEERVSPFPSWPIREFSKRRLSAEMRILT